MTSGLIGGLICPVDAAREGGEIAGGQEVAAGDGLIAIRALADQGDAGPTITDLALAEKVGRLLCCQRPRRK